MITTVLSKIRKSFSRNIPVARAPERNPSKREFQDGIARRETEMFGTGAFRRLDRISRWEVANKMSHHDISLP